MCPRMAEAVLPFRACPARDLVCGVPPEHQGGPPQRDPGPVGERDPPDRLTVDERAVGGAQVHQYHLITFHTQFRVMTGHTWINEAQVAVGSTAEHGHR